MRELQSYLQGSWVTGNGDTTVLHHAVTGAPFAALRPSGLDTKGALQYARTIGGPALRKLTFHARARMLKQMAQYLMERKDQFYSISSATGATKADSWIDIEGGIGTFYVTSSKGRREFPDDFVFAEGSTEALSKGGTFVGRHICVPLEGAAIHINAFNFPCWGMLEKVASSFLAGVPSIVKPASATSYLAEAMVREMIASRIFPEGSLQLICGSVGDLFEHLNCQDVVTFTGSAETGRKLKSHPKIINESIRFNLEADSLNCSILGADARPGTEEFDLFIKEVAREMTVKAGQKCTAIRRTIVPDDMVGEVISALKKRLSSVIVGDPAVEGVRMGPLVGKDQVAEVQRCVESLSKSSELVLGGFKDFNITGGSVESGAFFPISLFHCANPLSAQEPHSIEAFGPVNTVMGYRTSDEAIELARMGKGSLVGSLFTANEDTARKIAIGLAPYHGRLVVLNRNNAKESTGHGSPLPHLVHGGPGRAGGGEEMGGIRGALHYMQRTAIQGTPQTLTTVSHEWTRGSEQLPAGKHPFQKFFDELAVGETLITASRTITDKDILDFAALSGDRFYAHMDDDLARTSVFEKRVAHGYFIVSAAAGLFVDPAPGPVLANYGLENLRFTQPVYIGDTITVRLTCKQKTAKDTPPGGIPQGVVAWDVEVMNQRSEPVAMYTVLTLVRRKV